MFLNQMNFIGFLQVTRLREYQGVDQDFDEIARRYHDLVTVSIYILFSHFSSLVDNGIRLWCS